MNIVNKEKEKKPKPLDLKEVISNVKVSRENLKMILKDKKEVKREFLNKLKQLEKQIEQSWKQIEENQKWFDKKWQELEKLEIRAILWWDFWRKEIEINRLQRQAGFGALPSEREKIGEEIKRINDYSKEIEEGFRGGRIDTEIIAKLKKEIEGDLEKEEQKESK